MLHTDVRQSLPKGTESLIRIFQFYWERSAAHKLLLQEFYRCKVCRFASPRCCGLTGAVWWLEGHWSVCEAGEEQPAWWWERSWTTWCQMLCFLSSLHYHETAGPVERSCLTPREVEDFSESFPCLGLIEGSQTCGIQCGANKHLSVSTWPHRLCMAVSFPMWAPGELLQCPVQSWSHQMLLCGEMENAAAVDWAINVEREQVVDGQGI